MSTKEELEEQLEMERFKGVYAKIESNNEAVNKKIDSNHNETQLILRQNLDQTIKTNGRVTKLENETQFFRTIGKYPRMAMLAVVGLCGLTIILGLGTIFKVF